MRQLLFIISLLCNNSAHAEKMLSESSVWIYTQKAYSVESRTYMPISACKYFVNGECEIDGKKYYNIWCVPDRSYDVDDESVASVEDTMYIMSLREENDRIYVPKSVYLNSCLAALIGIGNQHLTEDDADKLFDQEGSEYVLYDFSTEQDNTIPYVGNVRSLLFFQEPLTPIIMGDSNPYRYSEELNLFYRDGMIRYINPTYFPNEFFPDVAVGIEVPFEYSYIPKETIVTSESDVNNHQLFAENNVWTYKRLGYYWNPKNGEIGPLCEVEFFKYYLNGSSVVSGRKYVDVWKRTISYVTSDNPWCNDRDTFCYDTHYVMSVREDCGKVYARNISTGSLLDNRDKSHLYITDSFDKEGYEYLIYDSSKQDVDVIHGVGHVLSLLFPDNNYTSNHLRFSSYYVSPSVYSVYHHESINLFYRNGVLEYKSPQFYPDPFFPDEVADGIGRLYTPVTLGDTSRIYNLQGQRMAQPQTGLNIVGGRKVLVR